MTSIKKAATAHLPTKHGEFTCVAYEDNNGQAHLAIIHGDLKNQPTNVRIHSQCVTGDALGSCRCDCGPQLNRALSFIAKEGGVVLYLPQEGRGIGLANKIRAYALQDEGMDTVQANEKLGFNADERDYTIAVEILKDLSIHKINLLTNNPHKVESLKRYGIDIVKRIPIIVEQTSENKKYLETKKEKLGHYF